MSGTIPKVRRAAFQRQDGLCFYCRRPMWQNHLHHFASGNCLTKAQARKRRCTAEHLLAKCDGGSDNLSNIAAACSYCNERRHQLATPPTPDEYRAYVLQELQAGRWSA